MRKYGHDSVQSIIKLACKAFLEDDSSPNSVSFVYKGHPVHAYFEWSKLKCCWYLERFYVVYPSYTQQYWVGSDYTVSSSWCW